MVTPFAGVWIEITFTFAPSISTFVTPFAGVWIEILEIALSLLGSGRSLPSRECGLKYRKSISLRPED